MFGITPNLDLYSYHMDIYSPFIFSFPSKILSVHFQRCKICAERIKGWLNGQPFFLRPSHPTSLQKLLKKTKYPKQGPREHSTTSSTFQSLYSYSLYIQSIFQYPSSSSNFPYPPSCHSLETHSILSSMCTIPSVIPSMLTTPTWMLHTHITR